MCTLVSGLPSLLKLAVPDDILSTVKNALSERGVSHESNERVPQVVGYLPARLAYYLERGIPYTDNQGGQST
ncbi:hypothetical protein DL89DRAFT_265119 [Linderina pennispora]|uniref:Uncharacterized protein n=1 Tax=Linderina pennispora TaxID=61395 RepID=A0A1Y1WI98_9FUNG|nr:uncharacterized protein DL89DRAFT_265119 [Linderina pennispora]ORX72946.1 hypothetical protein DL89DRAFT_265119 [Linderina pennispora]